MLNFTELYFLVRGMNGGLHGGTTLQACLFLKKEMRDIKEQLVPKPLSLWFIVSDGTVAFSVAILNKYRDDAHA